MPSGATPCTAASRPACGGLNSYKRQAELAAENVGARRDSASGISTMPWKHVCFNHFHDVLGGTSILSAYLQSYDELGSATNTAA